MVIVAAAAVLIAGPAFLWGRSTQFEKIARFHAQERTKLGRLFSDLDLYLMTTPISLPHDFAPEERRRLLEEWHQRFSIAKSAMLSVAYHYDQEQKYKSAATHPWFVISADPPAPPTPSENELRQLRAEFDKLLSEIE
jgi:hypothetical protein